AEEDENARDIYPASARIEALIGSPNLVRRDDLFRLEGRVDRRVESQGDDARARPRQAQGRMVSRAHPDLRAAATAAPPRSADAACEHPFPAFWTAASPRARATAPGFWCT